MKKRGQPRFSSGRLIEEIGAGMRLLIRWRSPAFAVS